MHIRYSIPFVYKVNNMNVLFAHSIMLLNAPYLYTCNVNILPGAVYTRCPVSSTNPTRQEELMLTHLKKNKKIEG